MSDGYNTAMFINKMFDIECSADEAIEIEQRLFKRMHAEISRLKAELEEERTACKGVMKDYQEVSAERLPLWDRIDDLERQLAEARAEVEEIYKIYNYAIDEQASLKAKITFWQSENIELRSKLAEYLKEVKMSEVSSATKVICLANDLQEVSKQAARECLEIFGTHTPARAARLIAEKFKLEDGLLPHQKEIIRALNKIFQ